MIVAHLLFGLLVGASAATWALICGATLLWALVVYSVVGSLALVSSGAIVLLTRQVTLRCKSYYKRAAR